MRAKTRVRRGPSFSLPMNKWCKILVVGDPLTREQTNEVLLRTNNSWTGQDDYWNDELAAIAGIELDQYGYPDWQQYRQATRELGLLNLEYMGNSRIVTSYIGGPHGWVDWRGRVHANSYNVGKNPSEAEIGDELAAIAKEFRYLRMIVQVLTGEDGREVAAQWRVADGSAIQVARRRKVTSLAAEDEDTIGEHLFNVLTSRDWGKGVDAERLREAVAQVRSTMAARRA